MRWMVIVALVGGLGISVAPMPAHAAGCLKGAVIGGVAGHYAGHHGLLARLRGFDSGKRDIGPDQVR